MKAAINGTVNLSVLDGWWAEAYDGRRGAKNGWGIPPAHDDQGDADRDRQDSTTLYETLQDEVVPLYYARDERLGYSPEWVQLCKRSMASVLPAFNSERVLRDYLREFYVPAARQGRVMAADELQASLASSGQWKEKVRAAWPGVALKLLGNPATEISFDGARHARGRGRAERLGAARRARRVPGAARARLGARRAGAGLRREPPAEARRRLSRGARRAARVCSRPVPSTRPASAAIGSSSNRRGPARCEYEVRAMPDHPHLSHPYELGLMRRL